jgi:hypothetical protein
MANLKTITVISIVLILMGLLLCTGCSDSNNNQNSTGNGRIRMDMVDDPATEFQHVYIEIVRVEVHQADADSNSGWIVVCSNPGIYDLLLLTNGLDTVLVDTMLAPGQYTQIRLYLGDNNTVVVNNQSYPLEIPSAQQSGLKLNHNFNIEPNVLYELTLDFNAEDEIHQTGNGQYMMNPVIRVQANAISGSISGTITPPAARPRIWTVAAADTVSTYADTTSGYFRLVCLPVGIYTVHVDPVAPWLGVAIPGVQVIAGQDHDLGTIGLSP